MLGNIKLQRTPSPDDFFVHVYRPAVTSDPNALEWPQQRLPIVLFSPGGGQSVIAGNQETYRHLFEPLVKEGFIVVAVEAPADYWGVAKRWRAMFCSLIWLQSPALGAWSERDNDRLNCDVVLAGHSRGGEAAWTATQLFQPFGDASVVMNTYTLRATIGVAPRSDPAPFGDEPSTPMSAEQAVPYLGIMGGNDEDVIGHAIRAFDILADEELGDLAPTPKTLLWVYDVPHNAWGGKSDQDLAGVVEPFKVEKARAILPAFVIPFLRHHVLEHGDAADNFAAMSGAFSANAVASDFPPAVVQPGFWDYLRDPIPADCSAMEQAGALSPATSGGNVTLEGLDPDQVCVGEHSMLSRTTPSTRRTRRAPYEFSGATETQGAQSSGISTFPLPTMRT
jgi:acetyl esterase/lipase